MASVDRLARGRAAADKGVTGSSLSKSGVVPVPDYFEFGKHYASGKQVSGHIAEAVCPCSHSGSPRIR